MKAEIREQVHYRNKYTLLLIPENEQEHQQVLQLQGEVRVNWTISAEPISSFDVTRFVFVMELR